MLINLIFTAFVQVSFLFFKVQSQSKYCNLICGSSHIVCLREPCRKGKMCGKDFQMVQLNNYQRYTIIALHNIIRNKMAEGNCWMSTHSVANMNVISYDRELEFVAQCAANMCFTEGMEQMCRSTSKHMHVGQNVFMTMDKSYLLKPLRLIRRAVDFWFESIKNIDNSQISDFTIRPEDNVEQAAQIIWAETNKIGCAGSYSNVTGILFICHYAPSTILRGKQSIYVKGPPCSLCNPKTCNIFYPYLCGQIRAPAADKFKPPFVIDVDTCAKTKFSNIMLLCIIAANRIFLSLLY